MTETARVLLTTGVLSVVAMAAFVWRLTRPSRAPHERLVGQLHLSWWAALLLAGSGAAGLGLAVAAEAAPGALVEATAGLATMALAAAVLHREPREALLVAGIMFLVHALFDWAHQSSIITSEFVPTWWSVGGACYDVYMAALCFLARR